MVEAGGGLRVESATRPKHPREMATRARGDLPRPRRSGTVRTPPQGPSHLPAGRLFVGPAGPDVLAVSRTVHAQLHTTRDEMQLTLREAASYLNVSEATVRRWISTRGLPAHRANERMYCNAVELWEWALESGIHVSRTLFERARQSGTEVPRLSALLAEGGVHHDVGGRTREEVLHEIVRLLPLPPDVDRDFLATVLEAREAMGSTGVGGGVAIPHVRNPILLHVDHPTVSVCLLRHPVEFDAIDGVPVHTLFVVVSPDVPTHLRILAQLGFVLRDEQLRRLLREGSPAEAILARVAEAEAAPRQSAPGPRSTRT